MRKTMNARAAGRYRRQLLATASAIALTASVYAAGAADAGEADRPVLWIESGWHFDKVRGAGEPYIPPLSSAVIQEGFTPASKLEGVLDYSYGADGKISFQPENSNWVFSASLRYGRAHGHKHLHQEKTVPASPFSIYIPGQGPVPETATMPNAYNEISTGDSESHAIIDFQAGKDVGLGLFGDRSTSIASAGLRFAQFAATSDTNAYARPDGHFVLMPQNLIGIMKYSPMPFYHNSASVAHRKSSFHGIGPSLSWNNSSPLIGQAEDGEIALDWGASAALLFGRQKTIVHHHTSSQSHYAAKFYPIPSNTSKYYEKQKASYNHSTVDHARARSVMVPNVGGFAGLSFRYSDAKLSVGYRADFFFSAIDGGVDTRHNTNRGFFGPFATLSIGMGD